MAGVEVDPSRGEEGGKNKEEEEEMADYGDEEEEEEEEEGDEEEGEGAGGKPDGKGAKRKRGGGTSGKKAKAKYNPYVDDVADVDEEEDEDEDDDGDDGDDGNEARELEREMVKRIHQRMDRQMDDVGGEKYDEEKLQQYINERYGSMARGAEMATVTTFEERRFQELAREPSSTDPTMWVVKCKTGKEREACMCLMQKFYDYQRAGTPLLIKSAVAQDHLKGYIYIEAYKESHVRDAINGLANIYKTKVDIVPIAQRVSALTVNKKAETLIAPKSFVRLKSGIYKEDLARVLDVNNQTMHVTVQLIPRIDFNLERMKAVRSERMSEARRHGEAIDEEEEEQFKAMVAKQKGQRPPPKPFNAEDAKAAGLGVNLIREGQHEFTVLSAGGHKFLGGYLVKTVTFRTLIRNITPTVEEIQAFSTGMHVKDGAYDDELTYLAKNAENSKLRLEAGDPVLVYKGELTGLQGIVERVLIGEVRIGKTNLGKELGEETMTLPIDDIKKWFQTGDHVKVIEGRHSGETGMVLKVDMEKDICTILGDLSYEEFDVFTSQLSPSKQVTSGHESLGNYRFGDCIMLDERTFGVIVKIEHEACRVLTNASTPERAAIRCAKLPDIQKSIRTRHLQTQDAYGNPISIGDLVLIVSGPGSGKKGSVKHLYRAILFIHCKDGIDNAGYLVTRAKSVQVAGGMKGGGLAGGGGGGGGGLTPSRPSSSMRSPSIGMASPSIHQAHMQMAMASPHINQGRNALSSSSSRFGGGGGGGMRGGGRRGGLELGTTLQIRAGRWKGYKGRITDVAEEFVKIELQAMENSRIVKVPRKIVDETYQSTLGQSNVANQYFAGMSQPYANPMRTPAHVPSTPFHRSGSMTPAYGDLTPSDMTAYNPNTYDLPITPVDVNDIPGSNLNPPTYQGQQGYYSFSPQEATPGTPGLGNTPITPGEDIAYNIGTGGVTSAAITPNADTPNYTPGEDGIATYGGVPTPSYTPGTNLPTPAAAPEDFATPGGVSFVGLLVTLNDRKMTLAIIRGLNPSNGKFLVEYDEDHNTKPAMELLRTEFSLLHPEPDHIRNKRIMGRVLAGECSGREYKLVSIDSGSVVVQPLGAPASDDVDMFDRKDIGLFYAK